VPKGLQCNGFRGYNRITWKIFKKGYKVGFWQKMGIKGQKMGKKMG